MGFGQEPAAGYYLAQTPSFPNASVGIPAVGYRLAQTPSFPNASVGNPGNYKVVDSRQRHSGMTKFISDPGLFEVGTIDYLFSSENTSWLLKVYSVTQARRPKKLTVTRRGEIAQPGSPVSLLSVCHWPSICAPWRAWPSSGTAASWPLQRI